MKPGAAALANLRIVMLHGDQSRHPFGRAMQRSFIAVGRNPKTRSAAMGVNLNYPTCGRDCLKLGAQGGQWQVLPTAGNWFADAFMGSMGVVAGLCGWGRPGPSHSPSRTRSAQSAGSRPRIFQASATESQCSFHNSPAGNAGLGGTRFVKTEVAIASAPLVETSAVAHCRPDFP
jgi:hypothetical protein